MEWITGYQTSVMSQELHFYHKAVTVLDLYHSHLNLYTKSALHTLHSQRSVGSNFPIYKYRALLLLVTTFQQPAHRLHILLVYNIMYEYNYQYHHLQSVFEQG